MVRNLASFSIFTFCIALLGIVPSLAQAHPWGCGAHVVSDTGTQWTHANVFGPTGVLQPAVVVSTVPTEWTSIPADDGPTPQFIWKAAAPEGTAAPVVFTKSFSGCSLTPYQGSLWINGDNSFVAFLNGVPVASCGTGPVYAGLLPFRCFQDYQRVGVEVLPTNELVIFSWNAVAEVPSPLYSYAMVQYRV